MNAARTKLKMTPGPAISSAAAEPKSRPVPMDPPRRPSPSAGAKLVPKPLVRRFLRSVLWHPALIPETLFLPKNGLALGLEALGIALVRTAVGDKYVILQMLARNLSLGGEQSGHIIFSDYLFHGRRPLHGAERPCARWRSYRTHARGISRADLTTLPAGAVERARAGEGGFVGRSRRVCGGDDARGVAPRLATGRLLSFCTPGTEPLLRVMLKGRDEPGNPQVGRGDCRRRPASTSG